MATTTFRMGGIEIIVGTGNSTTPVKRMDNKTVWLFSDEDDHGGTFSRDELEQVLRQFINDRI